MPQLTTADWASTDDHTDMLVESLKKCMYPTADPLCLAQGVWNYNSQLTMGQSAWIKGAQGCDGGTGLNWTGPDGIPSIVAQQYSTAMSRACVESIRFTYGGTGKPGQAIEWLFTANRTRIWACEFIRWPALAVHIGAPSGKSTDCVEVYAWFVYDDPNASGIAIDHLDNFAKLWINSDSSGGPVVTISHTAPDDAWIRLGGKHEVHDSTTPYLYLPDNTYGTLRVGDAVQRNPLGVASDFIVQANSAKSRLSLDTVIGGMLNGPSGPGIVYQRDKNKRIYGPVQTPMVTQ